METISIYAQPSRVAWATISETPITVDDAEKAISAEVLRGSGAVVTFAGVVRDHDEGKEVADLHYEGHPDAETAIRRVAERIASEFTGRNRVEISVAHRVGDLKIGDAALVAAVASPHRQAAFEACATLVDEIKREVPIWKHQSFRDGSDEWVHAIG